MTWQYRALYVIWLALLSVSWAVAEPVTARFAAERQIDVLHYRLELVPDLAKHSITGKVLIKLKPYVLEISDLELDCGDLKIHSVTRHGSTGPSVKSYSRSGTKLRIKLASELKRHQEMQLTVRYSGTPSTGLYFTGINDARAGRYPQIWTQGQPNDNQYWFPLSDRPDDKATSDVLVTVPNDLIVVANGKLVDVVKSKSTSTWHWRQFKAHAPYLISFVAGELLEASTGTASGIPINYYGFPGDREILQHSFSVTPAALEFFATWLDSTYPWDKYSQVLVQDFIPAGMENTSVSNIARWLSHPPTLSATRLERTTNIVAHEIVHQWLGNLVTAKDWSNIWLNEGFASYLTALFLRKQFGEDAYAAELYRMAEEYYGGHGSGDQQALVMHYYAEAWETFESSSTYNKGAWLLRSLNHYLGDTLFQRGVREFVERYAFGAADSSDLHSIFERISKRDLDWFFETWVYQAGVPEFEVAWDYDDEDEQVVLTVKQVQSGKRNIFVSPVDIDLVFKGSRKRKRVWVSSKEETFRFPTRARPITVLFDPDVQLLKVQSDNYRFGELRWQLLHDRSRLGRVHAARNLSKRFYGEKRTVKLFAKTLVNENSPFVRSIIVRTLGRMRLPAAGNILRRHFAVERNLMVKRTVIDHLSSYPSEEVYQLLNEVIRKETQHDLVATALESLGHIRHPNSYRILVKQLDRESFRDGIRYATLQGLTHLGDVRALRVSRAYMAPEYLPHVRLAALNLRYSLSRTDPTLISLLQKLTSDRDRNIRRRAWAILGTTGKTSAVLEFIEQALKSHQARDIRSAQQNALKAVKSRIAQRKKAKLIL